MSSLRDQLLQAGLVSQKAAAKAGQKKRKSRQLQKQAKALAEQQLQEKKARDQALNAERQAAAREKAIAAQIRQILISHRIGTGQGVVYHFNDGGKVRQLTVSPVQQRQLAAGQLAIVRDDDSQYVLLPQTAAEKIAQRQPERVLVCNPRQTDTKGDEDDPYADYPVPDDLMW